MAKDKPNKGRPQAQPVGHDEVERPRIIVENTTQNPQRAGDLVFPFLLRLHVQEERKASPDEQG
jgi:hypothetical protein